MRWRRCAARSRRLRRAGVSAAVAQEGVQVQTLIGLAESGLGLAVVPAVSGAHAPAGVAFRPIRDLPRDAAIGIALAFHASEGNSMARRFRDQVTAPSAGGGPS